jgi:hypothetical protein
MQTFRDNAGRTWTVAIDVAAIKRVRSLIGYDLLAVLDGTGTQALVSDPVLLVDVLYALCRPETDRLAVTDEDFGRSMAGDAIEHATQALLEELVSFCPNPRDRKNLRRVVSAMWTTMERARDVVESRIESDLQSAMNRSLAALGGSSGSSPGSSASIPMG